MMDVDEIWERNLDDVVGTMAWDPLARSRAEAKGAATQATGAAGRGKWDSTILLFFRSLRGFEARGGEKCHTRIRIPKRVFVDTAGDRREKTLAGNSSS